MQINGGDALIAQQRRANIAAGRDAEEDFDEANSQYLEEAGIKAGETKKKALETYEQSKGIDLGRLLGAIFLGPFIGNLIGEGIAKAAEHGHSERAAEAELQAKLQDIHIDEAFDDRLDAEAALERVEDFDEGLTRLQSELNEGAWSGIER